MAKPTASDFRIQDNRLALAFARQIADVVRLYFKSARTPTRVYHRTDIDVLAAHPALVIPGRKRSSGNKDAGVYRADAYLGFNNGKGSTGGFSFWLACYMPSDRWIEIIRRARTIKETVMGCDVGIITDDSMDGDTIASEGLLVARFKKDPERAEGYALVETWGCLRENGEYVRE